jgi:hypothetical protein
MNDKYITLQPLSCPHWLYCDFLSVPRNVIPQCDESLERRQPQLFQCGAAWTVRLAALRDEED